MRAEKTITRKITSTKYNVTAMAATVNDKKNKEYDNYEKRLDKQDKKGVNMQKNT